MKSIHDAYGLTRVLNARGTFTPLGVSRSSVRVRAAVAASLAEYYVIDELQAVLSARVAGLFGAEAAAAVHCVAAAITVAVAAVMTGEAPERVAALPDASGMPNRVVIPAGHVVDYGHSILTAIRLAGATPVIAGTELRCDIADLEHALAGEHTACLLLVSSRLVQGESLDLARGVAAAHERGLPAIIDGAAQDLRLPSLLATGADLVLVSAQKYLAGPTAGLIVGRRQLVRSCRAQERGIGRGMKATKEALVGVLAAVDERAALDLPAWQAEQDRKVAWFLAQASGIPGIAMSAAPDSSGLPFSRVRLQIGPTHRLATAAALSAALREGAPSIWVMDHAACDGSLLLELVSLRDDEMGEIISRLSALSVPESMNRR